MKAKNNDLIMQNKVFGLVALVTGLLLSLPYMAMQFNWQVPDPGSSISSGVNWTLGDFIVMGSLLFISGSVFVLVARKFPKNRVVVGIIVAIAFLWLWAELAVGVFTNWGS